MTKQKNFLEFPIKLKAFGGLQEPVKNRLRLFWPFSLKTGFLIFIDIFWPMVSFLAFKDHSKGLSNVAINKSSNGGVSL